MTTELKERLIMDIKRALCVMPSSTWEDSPINKYDYIEIIVCRQIKALCDAYEIEIQELKQLAKNV